MARKSSARSDRLPARLAYYGALGAILLLQAAPTPLPAREPEPAPVAVQAARSTAPAAPRPAETRRAPAPARTPAPAPVLSTAFPEVHTELPIHQWLRSGEYAWNDEGVPAGPLTIVVNIRSRTLSAYRAGFEIGRSSLIYGSNDKPTPLGVFPILEKDEVHYSSIYDRAPMPHTLRLTGDGVAIHGSAMADDYATHGCIGLPKEFAALLFRAAHVGDRVIVWKGDRLPGGESA